MPVGLQATLVQAIPSRARPNEATEPRKYSGRVGRRATRAGANGSLLKGPRCELTRLTVDGLTAKGHDPAQGSVLVQLTSIEADLHRGRSPVETFCNGQTWNRSFENVSRRALRRLAVDSPETPAPAQVDDPPPKGR